MKLETGLIQFAAVTHTGLKRSRNEDSFAAEPALGLWLVADGVGGHADGDVASAIVKSTIVAEVASGATLLTAIRHAHAEVLAEIARLGTDTRMGSTVVGLCLREKSYTLVWVGDSRAYLWDGEKVQQLSHDHTHVRDLVDRGLLTVEEAATHPDRHALTQSIGISSDMNLEPGEVHGNLLPGQQILLCSDGLTDELSDDTIAAYFSAQASVQGQVDALIGAALAAGGRDNITVLVVGEPASRKQSSAAQTARKYRWPVLAVLLIVVAAVLWD